jgi:hypothetical protein
LVRHCQTYTGWLCPPCKLHPVMAGAQSILSFLATRFKPGIPGSIKEYNFRSR